MSEADAIEQTATSEAEQIATETSPAASTEGASVDTENTTNQTDTVGETDTLVEYTDFTVPEGVELNQELLGEFKDVAKGLKLNQEQAQALTDLGVKQAQAIFAKQEAARLAEVASWEQAAKTDKEFGGEKLQENLAVAKKAMDAFGTPELKAVLDKSGLGSHPELIRAFFKAGQLISEDRLVVGGRQPVTGSKTAAQVLYG